MYTLHSDCPTTKPWDDAACKVNIRQYSRQGQWQTVQLTRSTSDSTACKVNGRQYSLQGQTQTVLPAKSLSASLMVQYLDDTGQPCIVSILSKKDQLQ